MPRARGACSTASAASARGWCTRRRRRALRRASALRGRARRTSPRGCAGRPRAVRAPARRHDERSVAPARVVRRRILRQSPSLRASRVDGEHGGRPGAPGKLELGTARCDRDLRTRRGEPDVERRRRQPLGGRDRDGADLERAEHDLGPVRGRARDDEDPVARPHARLAKQRRPVAGALRELEEGPRLDDDVVPEVRERAPLLVHAERLHDVAREVESRRDAPRPVHERRRERGLDRADRLLDLGRRPASTEEKGLHGTSVIGAETPRVRPANE